MVRWLVAGAGGMLGRDVVEMLAARGEDVRAADRAALDVTDPAACRDAVAGADVVVSCAAYTAVDAAEQDEATAFAINATGAANLARAAAAYGARMVQVSTDYVFAGTASSPYAEDAPVAPRSAYGRSKAAGDWAVRAECPDHLVVRTAWLYGAHGPCFPRTILRVARERGGVAVVADQVGQPTWTVDVADLVHRLVRTAAPSGTYHATSSGQASWYEFARAVVTAGGLDPEVVTRTTGDAYVRPAPRPSYSVLGHGALHAAGLAPIGDWADRWQEAAAGVLGAVPAGEA